MSLSLRRTLVLLIVNQQSQVSGLLMCACRYDWRFTLILKVPNVQVLPDWCRSGGEWHNGRCTKIFSWV